MAITYWRNVLSAGDPLVETWSVFCIGLILSVLPTASIHVLLEVWFAYADLQMDEFW